MHIKMKIAVVAMVCIVGIVFFDMKSYFVSNNVVSMEGGIEKKAPSKEVVNQSNPHDFFLNPLALKSDFTIDDLYSKFGKPQHETRTKTPNPYYKSFDMMYQLYYEGLNIVGIQLSQEAGNRFLIAKVELEPNKRSLGFIRLGLDKSVFKEILGLELEAKKKVIRVSKTESDVIELHFDADDKLVKCIWFFHTG